MSGEPWPPRAPGPEKLETFDLFPNRRGANQEPMPPSAVKPPDGEGPAFAWHNHSWRRELKRSILYIAIYGTALTVLISMDESRGKWWLLLSLLAVPLVVYFRSTGSSCSAGVEWLRRERGGWVRTYELDTVEVIGIGNGLIYMGDTGGRDVNIDTCDAFANKHLWDLVYNGILHSVVLGGARTNKAARDFLDLPPKTGKR